MPEPTTATPVSDTGPAKAVSGWMSAINQTPPDSTIKPVNQPATPPPAQTPPPAKPSAEEPPKPTEKPVEAAVTAEDEEKFPRTGDDWQKFKAKRKERELALNEQVKSISKERDELNERLKGLTSFSDTPEYKALVKERDELSDRLRVVEVTQHPKFKAYYESRTNAQIELAKRIVGEEKGADVAKLLQMPDSEWRTQQIREFVSELDVLDQSRLGGVLNSLAQIDSERQGEIAKARENYDAMQAKSKQDFESQQRQVTAFVDNGIKAITDAAKGHPAFQKRENDTEWNAAVDKRIEAVKTLAVGKVSQQQIFDTIVHSVAYHQVLSDNKALRDNNTKLQEQVKALTAAQPKAEGGQSRAAANGGEPAAPKMPKRGASPMEATAGWVQSMKASQNQE